MSGGRQRTSNEYFLANRKMSPYPVALSVLVSIISAVTYIGTPAETYLYGAAFWQNSLSRPIGALLIMFVTLPVFYNLQVASIFEYLELRFNSVVRYTGMITNLLFILVYMGIVIYAPALALNAVTGLSIEASTLTVGLVCTFYTTIGGIKAVVWTDVFQSAIMICGMLITIIGGTVSIGGVGEVWNRAQDGKRTVLVDFSFDPTVRYSLWSCVIGGTFAVSSFAGTNQLLVQRYLTCRSLKSAQTATFVGLLLFSLIDIISVITGTVTYAYFAGCDPISNKDISKPDQIIPLLMIRLFSRIPGLTGVLLSAAFSASLSSVSSGINALTTLTGQGIFRKIWPDIKESKFTFLSKLTSIFFGFLCIALAFLAPLLGNVLQVTLSIAGICNGTVLGVFLLGILLPWANWKGAIVGFWLGLSVGCWIQIGSIVYPPVRQMMPLSIDSCPVNLQANSSVYILHDKVVLLFSAAIGIYHAMSGGRQRTSSEYFLANRSMSPYPVAMSILVSIVSAITYIGTPAETYLYGAAQWQSSFSRPIVALVIMFVTLPVFYNLQVTSIFEYLERRFNSVVSYTGMIANVLYILVYMGIVIYAPALTLNAVTGLSIPASTLAVGLVCTFYTTIGGIKAVVWTDVFQSIIMLSGMLITIIGVTISVGGVREVWNRAEYGGRTVLFDFRVDPTVRYSLWSCAIGSTFVLLSLGGTNQLLVQRYLTCRTLNGARIAVLVGLLLFSLVDIISVATGVVSYAYFAGCDPISNNDISKPDQIIPLVMIRLFSRYPGLTGILVSAAFSASLSSVSSGINAMTTLTGEGVFRKIWPRMEESKFTFLTKMISIFYGLLCIGLAFLSPLLGNILSVTLSFLGICNGPVFGMFILGTCFPWANWMGAFGGFWTGLIVGLWLQIGSLIYPHERQMLPMSTDSCPSKTELNDTLSPTYTLNTQDFYATSPSFFDSSTTASTHDSLSTVVWLYHISYLYYALATFLTTFSFGVFISIVTGPTDSSTLDGSLLSPIVFVIHRCLPKSIKNKVKLQEDPYLGAKCNGTEVRKNESHL
ncbi:Sodium-coupled monocarboxylate transporter 2 [Holothuria leucospilota]|uniref:Sodium-coupled monocarboxylate transporter 2 n=1 Tax=Holothuria leucospilota TaxID=206669 RepID=A0A9Q1CHL9_HOLLE|nr:Sodium-coupled monocarboxylate transporter 2 [Holothuria leucospilota]